MKNSVKVLWAISAIVTILIVVALVKEVAPSPGPTTKPTPKSAPVTNPYLSKYAGGYTVEVTGYSGGDIESYVLHSNGSAKWMWIVPDASQGARVDSEKSGSWTASDGVIAISIRGKTGTIKEDFRLRGDRFYSTTSSDRYLKPTQ